MHGSNPAGNVARPRAGEFTLTVELVRRLQARRVTCLAATSTRNVDEHTNGKKISTFTFVRFRAYAEPGAV